MSRIVAVTLLLWLVGAPVFAVPGNQVRVLVDGPEITARVQHLLDRIPAGKGYVRIGLYEWDPALPKEAPLVASLRRLAQARTPVHVLLWVLSEPATLGSSIVGHWSARIPEANEATARALLADPKLPISVLFQEHPMFIGAYHQKVFLFNDGSSTTAIVGSLNYGDRYLVPPPHEKGGYHDVAVEIRGPAVRDVEADFVERWNSEAEPAARLPAAPANRVRPGNAHVKVVATRPHAGELKQRSQGFPRQFVHYSGDLRSELIKAIEASRRSIYLENYSIHDPTLIEALGRRLAQNRDLELTLNVGNHYAGLEDIEPYPWLHYVTYLHLSFQRCEALTYRGASAEHTVKRGADWRFVYEGNVYQNSYVLCDGQKIPLTAISGFDKDVPLYGTRSLFAHSKVAVFDDERAYVGSGNFNIRSMQIDGELGVLFDGPQVMELRERLRGEFAGKLQALHLGDLRVDAPDFKVFNAADY